MNRAFAVSAVVALAIAVGGCQTTQESLVSAQVNCDSQGYRPNSAAYKRCVRANYAQNRADNDAAAAVVGGAVAGALVGAAVTAPYYRRSYYYSPYYW